MPQSNPGSLKPAEVTDLMALLVSKTTAPAGETPLPTDSAALKTIKFFSKKPGA